MGMNDECVRIQWRQVEQGLGPTLKRVMAGNSGGGKSQSGSHAGPQY